jgi:PAS domain S-box-containing protein
VGQSPDDDSGAHFSAGDCAVGRTCGKYPLKAFPSYLKSLDKNARRFYSIRNLPELSAILLLTASNHEHPGEGFLNGLPQKLLLVIQEPLEVNTMAKELRKSGISVVGDLPWGAHFCCFYETKQDLLDILIPYFKTGLENKEFCLWVISNSELLTVQEATSALRNALPDLDRYVADRSIEVVGHEEWFLSGKTFDPFKVANRFNKKVNEALARGYAGMRVNGSPAWLHDAGPKELRKFEAELDKLFPNERTIASCTYPLASIGGEEIFDVVRTHQFAIARRQGEWEVVETPELIEAKAEIQRLNQGLEQRVAERTNELAAANEDLRREIAERKHAEALLHAREQEFRAIVENAPDQIIRYDRNFRRTYVNPAVARAYGLPREALIGKPIGSVIEDAGLDVKEDELTQLRQQIANVFESGQSYEYELNWPLPAGRAYFSVRLFPELDLNGSVINVLGISRDITERKTAEQELKKEKEILEKIFDNIPVMIGFVDDDGVKLVNPEWERTIGWTLKELQEQNVDIFAEAYPDPSYRQEVLDFVAAATGEWIDLKIRIRDGRVIDAACAVVHLSNGTKVAIAQDITERKHAEEKLKRSESQLAEAQRLAHVGSFEWDLRSNTVIWSDELYRIFGLQPGEINVAGDAMSFIHPEDRDLVLSTVKRSVEDKEPYSLYYRVLRPDGDQRIVYSRGLIVSGEQGEPIRVFGASQDVTERKQAEEALRVAEQKYRDIFENAGEGIFQSTPDGRYIAANPALARMYGFASPEELIHSRQDISLQVYVDPTRREEFKHQLEDKGAVRGFEHEVFRKDGSQIWISVNARAVREKHGAIQYYEGTAQDITERKAAEEKLRATAEQLRTLSGRLQMAKEEEAVRIAREIHDELGSALSSLKWDLKLIDKDFIQAKDGEQLSKAREKIAAMKGVIDDIINAIRRISAELRPSALDDLGLVAAIRWHARQFEERTGIVAHLDSSLENIDLTQQQATAVFRIFEQAMTNIMRHAKATRVDIQLEKENGELALTIGDNGRGITQGEKSDRQSLGLLGMRERAVLLGGKVDITGSKGKGTVVTVRVPLSAKP